MSFAASLRRTRNNNRVRPVQAFCGIPYAGDVTLPPRRAAIAAVAAAAVLPPGQGWRSLPPLPAPRAAGGAAVVRGRLYVAGGVGPAGLARQTFVLDLRRRRWSSLPG